MNVIRMKQEEWLEKGFNLFGIDKNEWKFVCPICETVSSVGDYKKLDAPAAAIAYSCIGRFLPKSEVQRAFSDKKIIKGKPCDYTTGGLFNISPLEMDSARYFNFYEENKK